MVYKVSVRPWSASIFSIVFCKHCKHWSTSSVLSSLSMPSTSSCLIWASSALDCETHNMISGPLSAFDPRHTFLFHQNMFTVDLPWRRNSSDCPGFPIGFQAAWVNYKFIVTKQCCHHHNNKIQKAITCTSQPFVGDQQVAPSSPRGGGASSETYHHQLWSTNLIAIIIIITLG